MNAIMAELFNKSQCNCCQQEIVGIGIECAECANKFRLCTECFSLGAEVGQHKSDHRYRFFDSGSLVIFPNESNWSAREEVRLLDAIEQYGFGNWQDISKHIESKTPTEAKEEYVKRFVQGTTGQVTWNNIKEKVQPPVDHTGPDDGPLSPSLTQKLAPLDIQPDEMAQLGYMPQRDDYEKEFDNDAEKLVSQLVFSTEDEDVDIALKLALVDMYSRRLRERVRRKRVIRDYQLVSQFFKKDRPAPKRQFSAYEKELQEQFKGYAQFHSAREHDHFIQNLVKEKELKFRLTECYKYRRNGIVRAEECVEFERFKSRRKTQLQNSKAAANNNATPEPPQSSGSISSVPDPPEVQTSSEDSAHIPQPQNQLMISPAPTNKVLSTLLATPTVIAEKRKGDEDYYPDKKRTAQQFSCDDSSLNCEELLSEVLSSPITEPPRRIQPPVCEESPNSWQHPTDEKPKDLEDQFTANMNTLPAVQLLTSPEKHLCLKTNLQPAQYLTIKTALLLTSPKKCHLGRPSNLKDSEWSQIVNFMTQSGWMSSRASASEAE